VAGGQLTSTVSHHRHTNRASITPSIESISEIKVQVNTFDPEMPYRRRRIQYSRQSRHEPLARQGLIKAPGWGFRNGWFANGPAFLFERNFAYTRRRILRRTHPKDKTFFFLAEKLQGRTRMTNPV